MTGGAYLGALHCYTLVTVVYQVQCALFYIENDAEIFLAHYTWKVAEKGFQMVYDK